MAVQEQVNISEIDKMINQILEVLPKPLRQDNALELIMNLLSDRKSSKRVVHRIATSERGALSIVFCVDIPSKDTPNQKPFTCKYALQRKNNVVAITTFIKEKERTIYEVLKEKIIKHHDPRRRGPLVGRQLTYFDLTGRKTGESFISKEGIISDGSTIKEEEAMQYFLKYGDKKYLC